MTNQPDAALGQVGYWARRALAFALTVAPTACADDAIPETYPVQTSPCARFEDREDLLAFSLYPTPTTKFQRQFDNIELRLPPEYVWRDEGRQARLRRGDAAGAVGFSVRRDDFAPRGKDIPNVVGFDVKVLVKPYVDLDAAVLRQGFSDEPPPQTGVPPGLKMIEDRNDGFDDLQVYIASGEQGSTTDFIRCRHVISFGRGHCGHLIEGADEIDIQITYYDTQLHRWKEYGDNARRLYACMRGWPEDALLDGK